MVRVSRMVRLLRAIPELVILLKGIGAAMRSVMVFFTLWLIIIYVYAVVFRQMTEGDEVGLEFFKSVPAAMNTLLLDGILPETSHFVNELASEDPVLWPVIISFILLAALTLMYMLIGVLVEVVGAIAVTEKEGMTVLSVSSQLRVAWKVLGRDIEASISHDDFVELLVEPEIVRIVQDVGVDVIALVDIAEVIFEEYEKGIKQMHFEQFVELMLKMRGGQQATVKDITEHLKVMRTTVQKGLDNQLTEFGEMLSGLHSEIKDQAQSMAAMTQRCMNQMVSRSEGSFGDSDDDDGDKKSDQLVSFPAGK
jgi:hypothetical protein